MSTSVPLLPPLSGPLMLTVYTHGSVNYASRTNNVFSKERLAELGGATFDLVSASVWFYKQPPLSAEEIKQERNKALSDDSISRIVGAYDMKANLRYAPEAAALIDTPEEARFLLMSYIGAVSHESGIGAVQQWLSQLLDPDSPPLPIPGSSPMSPRQPSYAPPPPPAGAPPPMPPGSPTTTPSGKGALALLNEKCTQQGKKVEWTSINGGEQHIPRWQVTCIIDGQERGKATARSTKNAKEEAAKAALLSLGWACKSTPLRLIVKLNA